MPAIKAPGQLGRNRKYGDRMETTTDVAAAMKEKASICSAGRLHIRMKEDRYLRQKAEQIASIVKAPNNQARLYMLCPGTYYRPSQVKRYKLNPISH